MTSRNGCIHRQGVTPLESFGNGCLLDSVARPPATRPHRGPLRMQHDAETRARSSIADLAEQGLKASGCCLPPVCSRHGTVSARRPPLLAHSERVDRLAARCRRRHPQPLAGGHRVALAHRPGPCRTEALSRRGEMSLHRENNLSRDVQYLRRFSRSRVGKLARIAAIHGPRHQHQNIDPVKIHGQR